MNTAGREGGAAPTNTLRMDVVELVRLHAAIDKLEGAAPMGGKGGAAKRSFHRWPYLKAAVRVDMTQPGGQPTQLHYATRNLSNTGVGVLHCAYIHVGTPAVVHMPLMQGGVTAIAGKVLRCRHLYARIHEVGIQFDAPVNPRDFLPIDPMRGDFTLESVDPARLTGSVLHIDDSPMDRRLVRHFLRDTGLSVTTAEDAAGAMARADEAFDIILCDDELPDATGAALVEQLRAHAVQTPVIMLTSGQMRSNGASEAVRDVKANAVLAKPFTQQQLLRALAEFLLADAAGNDVGGPIYSTLSAADDTATLVPEFLDDLKASAAGLSKAISENDSATARRLCFQIRGAAPSLGFTVIAEAAEAALAALDGGAIADAAKHLRALVFAAMRARVRESEKDKAPAAEGSPAKAA